MYRFCLLGIVGLLILWAASGPDLRAQNRTTVALEFDGRDDLRQQVEQRLSRLLTELNRASYFDDRPDLTDQPLTEAGKTDVLTHWDRARFRCPKTTLRRPLVRVDGEGGYAVRSVPLLVETETEAAEERTGVFVLDALGRVDGFRYRSESETDRPTGAITVRTEPPGATVISAIGGGTRRQAPARFEEVPADAYAFTIRKGGYQSVVDTPLVVRAGESVEHTIRLPSATGQLDVRVEAEGATLRIDGEPHVPGRHSVDAGAHAVSVSGPDVAPWDSTVTVPPGDTVRLDPQLRPKRVPLTARSDPEGATVTINGDAFGTTPLDTTVQAGRTYALQFEKNQHVPSPTRRVVAPADTTLRPRVVLPRVELRSTADRARLSNLRVDRSGPEVDLYYALVGESGETYRVDVDVLGPDGSPLGVPPSAVEGALGEELAPGPDKRITWRPGETDAQTVRLVLRQDDGGNRLLYVIGGALAVGGGAAAALLLGGDGGGGGNEFPPPPGLPN